MESKYGLYYKKTAEFMYNNARDIKNMQRNELF